ncbi:MAG: hypothetical protein KDE00_08700 [Rhodobacteraceae bacterium]|nr:hypothetical protein [Paracoccaceae bacterium]
MSRSATPAYPFWGMLSALAGLAALQALAYLHAGVFEYPLDDVYIHLAMASNIAHGTYGVNAGEPASAASSILYPLLLLPFPNTEFQRLLPLFWNVLAVGAAGWVWGRIVTEAGLAGFLGGAFAILAPICLNMSGTGFTGMEAAPHVLASLLTVLGLWRVLKGEGVAPWFVAAAILAPLLRYEGLALSLGSAAALALAGERRAAAVIALGAIAGVAAFGAFLVSIGLPPLPGSVLAKTGSLDPNGSPLMRYVIGFVVNVTRKPAGAVIGVLCLAALLAPLVPALRRRAPLSLLLVVAAAGLGHLLFGQIGWMHRYEPYILTALVATLLLATSGVAGRGAAILRCAAAAAVLAAGAAYLPGMIGSYAWNPRAIHLQQAQMARLAQDWLKVPVAVNDLGQVAWGNPDYVLDIWGLGSEEARRIRFGTEVPPPHWAAPLAEKHGVRAAMIYDKWFGTAVGTDWIRVASLQMRDPEGALGDWEVAIYATDPSYAPELRSRLTAFAPTLPADAYLEMEPGA